MIEIEEFENVPLKKELGNKKKSYIEESMAGGVDDFLKYITQRSKYLSKNEIKAIALLKDVPYLKNEVENILLLSVHTKGWITEKLFKFWVPFTKAFQTIYYNKRVQRALKKLNIGVGQGDW